MKSIDLYLGF